jgi:hypothetical protein
MKFQNGMSLKYVLVLTLIFCLFSLTFPSISQAQEPTEEPTDCPETAASPEPTEIPPDPPPSYFAEVTNETTSFSITLNYYEENSWISGVWEYNVEGEPRRLSAWYGPVNEDGSFSSELNIRIDPDYTFIPTVVAGQLLSETEVEGAFKFNDGEWLSWTGSLKTPSADSTADIPPNTVTGVIYRSDTALVVEGATVSLDKWVYNCGELEYETVETLTTAEDGVYTFTDVEPGQYSFTVTLNVTGEISPCETNGVMFSSDGIKFTAILDNGDYVLSRGDYGNFTLSDGEIIDRNLDLYCS